MGEIPASTWLGMLFLFSVVFGIMLLAYDDGIPFGLFKKIRCRFGKHTFRVGYRGHTRKYYCQSCKSPRKHPQLTAVEGGKKDLDVHYKF